MTLRRLPLALANSTGYATFINSLLCPTDSAPVLVTVAGTLNATHNYNVNYRLGLSGCSISRGAAHGRAERTLLREFTRQPCELRRWHVEHGRRDRDGAVDSRRDVRQQSAGRFPRHRRQRDHRSATQFGRRLCLAVPEPAVDDHAISGHPRSAVALRAPGHSMYNHRRVPNDHTPRLPGRLAAQQPLRPALELAVAQYYGTKHASRRGQLPPGRRTRPVHQEFDQRRESGRRSGPSPVARSSAPMPTDRWPPRNTDLKDRGRAKKSVRP